MELFENEEKQENAGVLGCTVCIACAVCLGCAVCATCLVLPLLGAGIIAASAAAVATSVTGVSAGIGVASL